MSFEHRIAQRSADVYADFLIPHLTPGTHLLDVGCGSGTISLGLASRVGRLIGVDLEDAFHEVRAYAESVGIGNVAFRVDDVYALSDRDGTSTRACPIRCSRRSRDRSTACVRSDAS